jgi:hypothetical protein
MRHIAFILVLMTCMVISAHAQFHGRCGDYRYTIDGKLISSVDIDSPGSENDINIKTYYRVDEKNGYIWFWIEETEAGKSRIGKYISLWSRLSELSTDSFNSNKNNPSEILVQLKSSQQFFFTTVYTTQKKGPQYEVRNKLAIRFKDDREASAFSHEVKQYIPRYN